MKLFIQVLRPRLHQIEENDLAVHMYCAQTRCGQTPGAALWSARRSQILPAIETLIRLFPGACCFAALPDSGNIFLIIKEMQGDPGFLPAQVPVPVLTGREPAWARLPVTWI